MDVFLHRTLTALWFVLSLGTGWFAMAWKQGEPNAGWVAVVMGLLSVVVWLAAAVLDADRRGQRFGPFR